jgi:hypothetical protein
MTKTEIFAWVRDVGALVGLATGLFVLAERFFRDRPLVFLRVVKGKLALRIHNVAEQDILVGPIEVSPALGVALSDDLIDVLTAAAREPFVLIVKAKSERQVDVIFHKDWSSAKPDELMLFKIPWKFTGNRWVWQWPVTVRKRVDELQLLLAAREEADGRK